MKLNSQGHSKRKAYCTSVAHFLHQTTGPGSNSLSRFITTIIRHAQLTVSAHALDSVPASTPTLSLDLRSSEFGSGLHSTHSQ